MDKTLIRRRFARSVRSYAEYAQAQRLIAERMCAMLRSLLPDRPADVLEIGCGTGTFTRLFMQQQRLKSGIGEHPSELMH